MSLLVDLMTNAIDQGYLDAAQRRTTSASAPAQAPQPTGRPTAAMVAIVLALAGALFATAAVATHRGAAASKRDRARLLQQIQQRTADTDSLQQQLDGLHAQVDSARTAALAASGEGSALSSEIDSLDETTGSEPVEGPGAEVTLDNAHGSDGAGADSLGTIYDRDVQAVVDALFATGAEAIAVNGQRLTSLTAIREAGEAILVDYRPLAPPYVIDAVGPPGLGDAFLKTQTGALYENWKQVYGLGFTVVDKARLTLPSATNQVVHYAQPLESP
jgi:uncharacterized protein YlxW (UPF0749 family)